MKNVSTKVANIVLLTLLLIAVTIFVYVVVTLSMIVKESQSYTRYSSCVLSYPALDRNQVVIDNCYQKVQDDTGVKIKRYTKYE